MRLNLTLSLLAVVSKLVPVMLTGVPAVAIDAEKPVIVGGPVAPVTVNAELLVVEPAGAVTAIGPVVAPAGTVVTIWFAVADVTVAAVPLKVTVF